MYTTTQTTHESALTAWSEALQSFVTENKIVASSGPAESLHRRFNYQLGTTTVA